MFDPEAPSSRQATEEFRKPGVREKLLVIAHEYSRNEADAEDLVADALFLVLDPERRPWIAGERSFSRHMGFVLHDLHIERSRTWAARKVLLAKKRPHPMAPPGPIEAALDDAAHAGPPVDTLFAEHEDRARLLGLGESLCVRLADDALALEVYDCACAGMEQPADQAAHLGRPIEEIREAHRRLKYHGGKVLAEEAQAERRGSLGESVARTPPTEPLR